MTNATSKTTNVQKSLIHDDSHNDTTQAIYEAAQELRESNNELIMEGTIPFVSQHDDTQDKVEGSLNNKEQSSKSACPYKFIPLRMSEGGRTHIVSEESKRLIHEEVTLDDLTKMTTLFYEKAFLDPTLDQFIRSHTDPHAERFAKWIHQKLSGSTVWDNERRQRSRKPIRIANGIHHVVHDRSSAHAAAWYSPKRQSKDVGNHFQLDECRVWMRLHFWALRESGILEKSPSFGNYYVRFIAHFVRVYESTAPKFTRDSYRWSANTKNIEKYINNGRKMTDVLGLSLRQAERQLPEDERDDYEYPYNKKPTICKNEETNV